MSTADYLQTIREKLAELGEVDSAPDLIEELHAHLQEAIDDLHRSGTSPQESEQEAVRRLGAPDLLALSVRLQRRSRTIRSSGRQTRSLIGALLVAATMVIVVGGNAVTSATTVMTVPPPPSPHVTNIPRQALPQQTLRQVP